MAGDHGDDLAKAEGVHGGLGATQQVRAAGEPGVRRHRPAHELAIATEPVERKLAHVLHYGGVHHPKDALLALHDQRVVLAVVVLGAVRVGEAAVVVCREHLGVRDAQALDHVEHGDPAVERAGNEVGRLVVTRAAWQVNAVVVVALVEVDDGLRLAHGLDEEGVVRPACAGVLDEADALLVDEVRAIDRRPDGGVRRDEHRTVGYRERLLARDHPRGELTGAGAGARRVVPTRDLGPRTLHDVHLPLERGGEVQHVLVHRQLEVVVRLDDRDPLARGHLQAAVAAGAVSAVLLVHGPHARVAGGVLVDHGRGPVRAAVIYQDDLELAVGLVADAVQTLPQELARVVDRDDDGDLRAGVL